MPVLWMLGSVLFWSLFPLVSVWGIEDLGIFDYIFWVFVINFIASYALLKIVPKVRKAKLPKIKSLDGGTKRDVILGCLAMVLSLAALLSSFFYMSRAGATIVYEVWPIIAMYVTPLLINRRGWEKLSARDLLFSLLAFAGIGFILYPEVKVQGGFFSVEDLGAKAFFILLLPLIGGVLMAVSSVVKARVSHNLEIKGNPIASVIFVKAYFSLVIAAISIPFILFWPDATSNFTTESLLALLFAGVGIYTFGDIAYTMGVLGSKKSSIVIMWFMVPIFSVIWLWVAGETTINPYIILGSMLIISSNLLITAKADDSYAYIVSVVSLMVFGVYCYFEEGLAMGDYYSGVAVPIMFFVILVAFVMDRLIKRDALEEELAIETINFIEANKGTKFKDDADALKQHIIAIVRTQDPEVINRHYNKVRNSGNKHLSDMWWKIDRLVLSKIRGTRFAEVFMLSVVGVLTIGVSIVYRPNNLVGDSFAMVLGTTIMFIFFTVIDLARERQNFSLHYKKDGKVVIDQSELKNLAAERIVSIVLIFMILAAFIMLLQHKYQMV